MAPRLVIGVVAAAGAGVLYLNGWSVRHAHIPLADFLIYDGVSVAFMAAGLIAWWRRPDNRSGPLMVIVGFLWFTPTLYAFKVDAATTAAALLDQSYLPVLAHLAIGFPTGHLQRRSDRVVVAVAYGWTLIGNALVAMTTDFSDCSSCGRNLLEVTSDPDAYDRATTIASLVTLAVTVLVCVTIARRWRAATDAARRIMAPAWLAAPPALIALSAKTVADEFDLVHTADRIVRSYLILGLAVLPIAVLIGVLRTQTSYLSLARLVGDPVTGSGAALRAALAHALHDPDLVVAYRTESGYVDEEGRAVELDAPARLVRTITASDGSELGALLLDPALADERQHVDTVVATARLALENERLHAEVRRQLVDLRAAATRVVDAGERERRRIERDLHDGAQQRLLALSMSLASARQRAGPDEAAMLERAGEQVQAAITELRELAHGIHPILLGQEGLAPALQAMAERAQVPVEVHCPRDRFPVQVETTAYFVAAEAITNAMRHAHASHVRIEVVVADKTLSLMATDDGVGGADANGSGLRGLADRVTAVGGRFAVTSGQQGTTISASLPCG